MRPTGPAADQNQPPAPKGASDGGGDGAPKDAGNLTVDQVAKISGEADTANGTPATTNNPPAPSSSGGGDGAPKDAANLTVDQVAKISGDCQCTPAAPTTDTPSDHPAGGGGGGGGGAPAGQVISSVEQAQQESGGSSEPTPSPSDNQDHGTTE